MSRSLLHDWEPSIENLSAEMNKIAEDIYNTAYARGKNHPDEVLDKIRAEIEKLQKMCDKNDLNLIAQYSAFGMVLEIIDKHKAESEVKE